MSKARSTLADVARAAGVSVATVSKVLNERADVAAHTRQRVLDELRAASYRPVGAHAAHQPQRRLIEVLLPAPQSSYSIEVLSGITENAYLFDFDVVIGRRFGADGGRADVDFDSLMRSGRA